MHIEDLIDKLAYSGISLAQYDQKIIDSFHGQTFMGSGFTEKQSTLAIRILKRYSVQLSLHLTNDITQFLENPTFKYKIRKSVTDRSIDIIDNKTIVVKFPYDETFISEIRKYKNSKTYATEGIMWDREQTAWIFPLHESNVQFLADRCSPAVFRYDDAFEHYASECEDILNNLEKYAPTLAIDDGELKILNSPRNMPKIDTDDIMEALFQARRYGVNLWDDHIEQYLSLSEHVDVKLRDFLKSMDAPLHLSLEKTDILTLNTLMKYMGPILVIVPGGSELAKMTQFVDLLNTSGVPNQNMSVLFRLSTETGRNFNDFVKNQGLNGPICEETKAVFVSGKLPKPLLKSNLQFNCIVNLGFDSAHYTLKEYVKNHPNLVYFDQKKQNKGHPLAFM